MSGFGTSFGGFERPESSRRIMADINVTPLVDVMLVLLVIFIITAPLLSYAIRLDLPKEVAPATDSTAPSVSLSIDADGRLYWNNDALSDDELRARVTAAAKLPDPPELQLRADKAVARAGRFRARSGPAGRARQAGLRHRSRVRPQSASGIRQVTVSARAAALLLLAALSSGALAELGVIDDGGAAVTLAQPAQRIVSLAPHVTEQLFAIGAGDRIVGTSDHSDYPAAARGIPRIARAHAINVEAVAALHPDLIVVWGSGYPPSLVEPLRRLGVAVYVNEPRTLADVATSMQRLGTLTGLDAAPAAASYTLQLDALRKAHATDVPVRVFYQVGRTADDGERPAFHQRSDRPVRWAQRLRRRAGPVARGVGGSRDRGRSATRGRGRARRASGRRRGRMATRPDAGGDPAGAVRHPRCRPDQPSRAAPARGNRRALCGNWADPETGRQVKMAASGGIIPC